MEKRRLPTPSCYGFGPLLILDDDLPNGRPDLCPDHGGTSVTCFMCAAWRVLAENAKKEFAEWCVVSGAG